jgi:regulator of protease activity HflC (stomatin/prohibitin superfamily)
VSWLGFTIALTLVGGIALIVRQYMPKRDPSRGETGDYRVAATVLAALCGLGFVILTLVSSIYIIDPGHVGIVKTFGTLTDVKTNGAVLVPPWATVDDVSVQVKRAEFNHITGFSAETQDVFVDATLNLSVSPKAIRQLYTTVGPNWYDVIVPSRVQQTIKEETVKFSTVQEAPHRAQISQDVQAALARQFAAFSIDVQGFQVNNIDFDQAFKVAIRNKQIATQRALAAKNNVQTAKYEAEQRVAAAQGDARATVARAAGQAEANRKLAKSLTKELIEFTAIQKLNPNVSTIVVPAGLSAILPSSIFGK